MGENATPSLQDKLAKGYRELAEQYDELAAELADETWLPLENQALALEFDLALL